MRLVFIIFFILLAVTIVVVIVHLRNSNKLSQYCSSDSDCPSGYLCKVNPEQEGKKQCFPANQIFCPITPVTELVKCRLDATGYCSDTCLNIPKFSCVSVNGKNPYVWKQGNQTINIPYSPDNYGWCLPDVKNRQVECNQFTSDYVLEKVGDNEYQWGCYCKYPNLFDHDPQTIGSNCEIVRACGQTNTVPLGSLYVPKPYTGAYRHCTNDAQCDPNDLCLGAEHPVPCGYNGATGGYSPIPGPCSDPANNCVCHTNWVNIPDQIDPLSGQCVCNSGYEFQCIVKASDYFLFNCAENKTCNGYEKSSNDCNMHNCYQDPQSHECVCCKCPSGSIRCPDDCTNPSLQEFCRINGPTCIPDPCNTSPSGQPPNGHWDPVGTACICATGFISVPDENNAVGAICLDPCNSAINPCGNRGKCIVQNNQAQCCDCVAPYSNEEDSTCTCSSEDPSLGHGNGAECCDDSVCASKNCGGNHVCSDGNYYPGHCTGQLPITWPCKKPDGSPNICTPSKPGPVICGTGTTASCPQDTTCCQNTAGSWNCCPFPNGICCNDNLHCCPSDHPVCDTQAGYCTKSGGGDPIPMAGYTGPSGG